MPLTRQSNYFYGSSQADVAEEIARYSKLAGYVSEHFADATCVCGGRTFRLAIDDDQGAAVRTCASCRHEHPVGDSEEYLEVAELEECSCPCGEEIFEVTVGVSLHGDSDDMRWLYVGCRCPACGITAVYGDWKNEFDGYRALLEQV